MDEALGLIKFLNNQEGLEEYLGPKVTPIPGGSPIDVAIAYKGYKNLKDKFAQLLTMYVEIRGREVLIVGPIPRSS